MTFLTLVIKKTRISLFRKIKTSGLQIQSSRINETISSK